MSQEKGSCAPPSLMWTKKTKTARSAEKRLKDVDNILLQYDKAIHTWQIFNSKLFVKVAAEAKILFFYV